MSILTRIFGWLYTLSLRLYPTEFRTEFGAEMEKIFRRATDSAKTEGWFHLIRFLGREIRNLPGAIWQTHLEVRKGNPAMENELNSSAPLTKNQMLVAMALFVLPVIPAILKFIFGYQSAINSIGHALTISLMIFIIIVLVLGFLNGIPRWSVPFIGIVVTSIVMLEPSWRIWELFYLPVQRAIGYYTKTLQVRVLYQTLRLGFFWFTVFIATVILVLLLAAWPRTRRLAQSIRRDWTLFSFMLYGGVVFAMNLVFEEYAYDELWKIASWVSLALGAWIYLKSSRPRKRILALLFGVTLAYWIAAIGKWIILPQQSWGAWYGYDHWTYLRFEFGSTIAQWGWVMFFMLIPALLTRIPRPATTGSSPEENLIPA